MTPTDHDLPPEKSGDQIRAETKAVLAETYQRHRQIAVSAIEREAPFITRALADLQSALARWDGAHPRPEQLVAKVEAVEARLGRVEWYLRLIRRCRKIP